jgi:hypothetical protein
VWILRNKIRGKYQNNQTGISQLVNKQMKVLRKLKNNQMLLSAV